MTSRGEYLFSLEGKVIIITGASRGIGEAIALGCISAGATVIGVARSEHPDNQSFSGTYLSCDIENYQEFEKLCKTVVKQKGRLDALINVAGMSMPSDTESDFDRFDRTLALNLTAVYRCCQIAAGFLEVGGSIVNVSSIGGLQGFPGNPGYVASKGGVRLLTKSLSVDYAERGIRVNCLLPGYVKTDMTAVSYNDPGLYAERLQRMIIKRWGEVEDLIGPAIFLVSDASSYITGIDLIVDGGWTAKGL